MRVLLVNTRHFRGGGDSSYTFNLADLLRANGHEVAFFAMQDERNLPDPNSDLFVSHIDFRELNRRKDPITGLQVLGRSIYSREARRKFGGLLDRFRPDVVHLQNLHAHITPSVIFEAEKRRLPVVWTLHDYKLVCPNSHFLIDATGAVCEACEEGNYLQAVLKRCKKSSPLASSMAALEAYAHRWLRVRERVGVFLAPSAFLRGKLLERGYPAQRVLHLPLVLSKEMFLDAAVDKDYLLFLRRLDTIKGIHPLMEACRSVPQVRLVLAGRVEDALVDQLPDLLPPNMEYVGMKQGVELRRLLSGARAVVVPSLWYENQPFSILEAFAAGKPVIASDLGGMTELVKGSERGLLVPPGDARALAEAMAWMVEHPEEAQLRGEKAREYARETHSPERHYERLMGVYGPLVKGAGFGSFVGASATIPTY